MEGREMLSASAFDLTALNLSEGQTVVVAKPTEGGFISARYSVAGLLSNNQLVLSGWNGDALHLTFSGTSSDAASPVGMAAGNGGAPG